MAESNEITVDRGKIMHQRTIDRSTSLESLVRVVDKLRLLLHFDFRRKVRFLTKDMG